MALVKDTPREFGSTLGLVPDRSWAVDASAKIYNGSYLGKNAGYVRPLQAGDVFVGVSMRHVDNSTGVAGAESVEVRREALMKGDVAGVTAITNEGANVYMSDDGTLTLTSTSNSLCGRIEAWISGAKCWIHLWGDGTKP